MMKKMRWVAQAVSFIFIVVGVCFLTFNKGWSVSVGLGLTIGLNLGIWSMGFIWKIYSAQLDAYHELVATQQRRIGELYRVLDKKVSFLEDASRRN